ncbi:MAG: NAD-dependent epimerase/dehydratase family protein [Acidobacteria bacterium]|nr:NAD-dependent epimerase/dehydratase family protein [Acidobacteriota bacterium]
MKILILGGTRFIGPHVVRHLVGAGHDVTVFHRGQTEPQPALRIRHIHGDRSRLEEFELVFRRLAPEAVLDMAAGRERDAKQTLTVFRRLARRFVVLSSMDVYLTCGRFLGTEPGPALAAPGDEDSPLRETLFPYRSKASGPDDPAYHYEKILVERHFLREAGSSTTLLRLPAVYGPGDPQRRLCEYLKRMDDSRPAILISEEKSRWRWSRGYVENVAAAVTLALTDERAAGRIYNLGEAENFTESEWVQRIGDAAGWKGEVVATPRDRLPAHLREEYDWSQHLAADTSKFRRELGFREAISPEESLRRTIDWERAAGTSGVEISKFDYAAEDEALSGVKTFVVPP